MTKETLQAARDLLASPAAWTQKASARTADAVRVNPQDSRACRWCLTGALDRVGGASGIDRFAIDAALARAVRAHWPWFRSGQCLTRYWLQAWNDAPGRQHRHILAVLDAASSRR